MPYCANCGSEYADDLPRCPQCIPPIKGGEDDEDLVKLATVASYPLAEMYAEMLRRQGVPCVVKGAGGWSSALPLQVIELYLFVPARDVRKAGEILADFAGPHEALNLENSVSIASRFGRAWRPQERRPGRGRWR